MPHVWRKWQLAPLVMGMPCYRVCQVPFGGACSRPWRIACLSCALGNCTKGASMPHGIVLEWVFLSAGWGRPACHAQGANARRHPAFAKTA
eukprot:11490073-Alexandrium_andersonii.AAC.1